MIDDLSKAWGLRLKEARLQRSWSVRRLAKELRCPWLYIPRWEAGLEPSAMWGLRIHCLLGTGLILPPIFLPRAEETPIITVQPKGPVVSWSPTLNKKEK